MTAEIMTAETMTAKRRPLGRSGLEIPPVTFGAWAVGGWYWGGTDDQKGIRAILRSVELGAAAVDTAPMYGFGHSEELVGRALDSLGARRKEVLVATKCGLRWDTDEGEPFFRTKDAKGRVVTVRRNLRPASIRAECEASLRRLRVETIDLYQVHWPDATTPLFDTAEALARLVEAGMVRAVGASNFDVPAMQELSGYLPIASVQPRYHLLDRAIEEALLPWCAENEVAVLTYSPLAQGILAGAVNEKRTFPPGDYRANQPLFAPEVLSRLKAPLGELAEMARRHEATMAQVAIAWVLGAPGVTSALVGARGPGQAEENAGAVKIALSPEEREHLSRVFAEANPSPERTS